MSQPPSITPAAPEVSIITSVQSIPGFDPETAFAYGIEFRDQLGLVPSGRWPRCPEPEDEKEDIPEDVPLSKFEPYTAYAVDGCSGLAKLNEMSTSARATLDAQLAWEIARELWTGETTGNPSLQSTATTITLSPSPAPAVVAAAALLAQFEECSKGGAKPFLHVPTVLIPQLLDAGFATRVGNRLVTPLGAVVIPGPGYPSSPGNWGPLADDEDLDSGAAADAGEAWMYVTGPVQLEMDEIRSLDSGNGATYSRLNKIEAIYERTVVYRFARNCTLAALAAVAG